MRGLSVLACLVKGMLTALVLGRIANPLQLVREQFKQLLFNPFFQRNVHHGATVTSTAKLQYGIAVIGEFGQGDASTVSGQ